MWIPPEVTDPILRHHPTRKSVGYFGAVRLRDGKLFCRRETGRFNGDTYWRFLRHLKHRASRSGRRAVVIVDNVRYHHARLHKAWREFHDERFRLYFLPPYSPELNPIERVWKLTRRKCLHNEYFPDLDNLIETVELQFRLWSEANDTLRRLCAIT
jgi:transposase